MESNKTSVPGREDWTSPKDNRMIFNAVLWITQSGAAWRDLPERFGSWKTVYSRFCKWRNDGTLQSIFNALNKDADYENLSIDSILVKAHQHSAGAKKERQDTKPTSRSEKAVVETPPRSLP